MAGAMAGGEGQVTMPSPERPPKPRPPALCLYLFSLRTLDIAPELHPPTLLPQPIADIRFPHSFFPRQTHTLVRLSLCARGDAHSPVSPPLYTPHASTGTTLRDSPRPCNKFLPSS